MLNLKNYTISNNKEKIKSATIEEGDDIVVVTFIAAKPQKKGKFAISLQQSEEGADNCRLLFQYKVAAFFAMLQAKKKEAKQKKEGDGTCHRLLREAALQRNSTARRRRPRQLPSPFFSSFSCTTQKRRRRR
jgi:hypothetical protein